MNSSTYGTYPKGGSDGGGRECFSRGGCCRGGVEVNQLVWRDEEDIPELEMDIEGGGDKGEGGDKLVPSTETTCCTGIGIALHARQKGLYFQS